MVMDAQPSPQSVGREFVRQYYTLLNKAPDHLHRFYKTHSSFVHGGLDSHNRETTVVVGQKNIHNKIQQLNFRDCHAKISQVDAMATLGNGVVVQVTGELSNDGQPMRRFTQTFVLAAQSAKNYYVHNDIFRYQDLYSDEENDGECRSDHEEEPESNITTTADNAQQSPMNQAPTYYSIQTPGGTHPVAQNATIPLQSYTPQTTQVNGIVHDDVLQNLQQTPATQIPQQPTIPTIQVVPQQQQQQPTTSPVMVQGLPPTNIIPIPQPNTVSPLPSMEVNNSIGIENTSSPQPTSNICTPNEPVLQSDTENKTDYPQK